MSETSCFARAWSDYRRRRRSCLGFWLGGLLTVSIFGTLSTVFGAVSPDNPWVAVLGFGWVAVLGVLAFRLTLFRCPRCTQYFSENPFARKCVNCGLLKWSEGYLHTAPPTTSLPFSMTPEAANYMHYRLSTLAPGRRACAHQSRCHR